jgi:membrane protease subunit HflC
MTRLIAVLGAVTLLLLVVVAFQTFFVVDVTEQALVLQFGLPIREIREPGLQMKVPFTQNVVYYDRRLLDFEPPSEEVIAADQKRLMVDAFARYRIVDPLQFYKSAGSEQNVNLRLGATLNGSLRRVLGGELLSKLLSPDRARIMGEIRDDVAAEAKSFGIDVIDVRIRRADLPKENSEAIYKRMQSERGREAKQYRAEGAEAALGIHADADKQVTVIRADAERQAQILKGEGDATSIKISADAFGQDAEFYAFYRSLEAYKKVLGVDTTMVLSPDSDFFRYLQHRPGGKSLP